MRHIDADKIDFRIPFSLDNNGDILIPLSAAKQAIAMTPTEDVAKVIHGYWTLNKDGSGTCNQCGTTQKNVWDYDNWQNYCGHCGANMKGGE